MAGRRGRRVCGRGPPSARRPSCLAPGNRVGRRQHRVDALEGDAVNRPVRDGVFKASAVAVGGRNVPGLTGAFREMNRVMVPGGRGDVRARSVLIALHMLRELLTA